MTYYMLIHGGYSYNVEGPFISQEEAADYRMRLGKSPERSRIVPIGTGPGGMTIDGRSRLSNGQWAWAGVNE